MQFMQCCMGEKPSQEAIDLALEQMGIESAKEQQVEKLSGGQQRRL